MIVLSFDTDYMTSETMKEFMTLFPFPGAGTFFLSDKFHGVDWKNHELCPHPLMKEESSWLSSLELAESYLPSKPKGYRAHSCAYSQYFGTVLAKRGYLYTSVTTPMFQDGLKPYIQPWGHWELPIFYMDSMDFVYKNNWSDYDKKTFDSKSIQTALNGDSLYVFDFHPLHILLNTTDWHSYAEIKPKIFDSNQSLSSLKMEGYGVRSFFEDLINGMIKKNLTSNTCLDVVLAQGQNSIFQK